MHRGLTIGRPRGPQASGYKANAWTFRPLHRHLRDKQACILDGRKALQRDGHTPQGSAPGAPVGGRPREAPRLQREQRKKIRTAARDGCRPPLAARGARMGRDGHKAAGPREAEAVRTPGAHRAPRRLCSRRPRRFFVMEASGPSSSKHALGFLTGRAGSSAGFQRRRQRRTPRPEQVHRHTEGGAGRPGRRRAPARARRRHRRARTRAAKAALSGAGLASSAP